MCERIRRPGYGIGTFREERSPSQIRSSGNCKRIRMNKKKGLERKYPSQQQLSALQFKKI